MAGNSFQTSPTVLLLFLTTSLLLGLLLLLINLPPLLISLASPHLALVSTWQVSTSLSFDHLPIIISLPDSDSNPSSPCSSYTNFHQADVEKFKRLTEAAFTAETPPTTAAEGAASIQRILNTAAKWSIPSGRRRCFVPGIS